MGRAVNLPAGSHLTRHAVAEKAANKRQTGGPGVAEAQAHRHGPVLGVDNRTGFVLVDDDRVDLVLEDEHRIGPVSAKEHRTEHVRMVVVQRPYPVLPMP
jgi:hypothetical protein